MFWKRGISVLRGGGTVLCKESGRLCQETRELILALLSGKNQLPSPAFRLFCQIKGALHPLRVPFSLRFCVTYSSAFPFAGSSFNESQPASHQLQTGVLTHSGCTVSLPKPDTHQG